MRPLAMLACMKSFPKFSALKIVVKALVIAVCVSVSLGNSARFLLPAFATATNDWSRVNSPSCPSSVPEESPPESPDSNELPKEGETASFALHRKCQKKERSHQLQARVIRWGNCQLHPTRAMRKGSQTDDSSFEHNYRNGCGSHLRC